MKTRGASYVLFFSLTMPFFVALCLFWWQEQKVEQAALHHLAEKTTPAELVMLQFSTQEASQLLRWEHAREFEYKGQMYDVVERIHRNDSIFLRCWWDKAETHLKGQIRGLINSAIGNVAPEKQHELPVGEIGFYKLLYCNHLSIYLDSFKVGSLSKCFCYRHHYLSYKRTPPVPPPQQFG